MEQQKIKHFMYIPWTGLGMYGGFRGNRWLRNRIKVFEHFVLPSLMAQTKQDFTIWCSWRPEERSNAIVQEFIQRHAGPRWVHTFHGVCFWDDKYDDVKARERLLSALHGSMGELFDTIGEVDTVLMTIQPSDDCYRHDAVEGIQRLLLVDKPELQAVGFRHGYMMNYLTKELHEYNPKTNPPFFTIKFDRKTFTDPLLHAEYTGPYKSHEYVGDKLRYGTIEERGFLVGTHGENISTVFNHPYKGEAVSAQALKQFGLYDVPPIKIKLSIRKWLLRKLPHKVQRKLRYWFGELFWNKLYEFLRN